MTNGEYKELLVQDLQKRLEYSFGTRKMMQTFIDENYAFMKPEVKQLSDFQDEIKFTIPGNDFTVKITYEAVHTQHMGINYETGEPKVISTNISHKIVCIN